MRNSKVIYWVVIFLVILISFLYFSPLTSYILHSDIGVQILMTYDFKWPENLYFWGQDRIGSIVPMFGHLLYKFSNLSPIASASISEYIFLTIGFLSLSTLFRTKKSKIIFAVSWFLPSFVFQELVQLSQPYATQACFLGVMIFFINESTKKNNSEKKKSLFFFFFGILSLFVSIWSSDLSWVAYLLLILTGVFRFVEIKNTGNPLKIVQVKKISREATIYLGVFILASFIGFLFIYYAKATAIRDEVYNNHLFGTLTEGLLILNSKTSLVYSTLIFERGDIFLSLHTLFFTVGVIVLLYFFVTKKSEKKIQTVWRNYFLFYTLFCGFALFSSYWVFGNFMANRYFTVLYVSIWIIILISIERYGGKKLFLLQSLFFGSAIFSAASSVAPYFFEGKSAETNRLYEFKKLGKIGVIGNYWYSYNISAVDPVNIKATPNELSQIRCKACVDSTLACATIYLIQDGWLDSFPKHIKQFGVDLERRNTSIKIGGYTVAPYSLVNFNKRFLPNELKTNFAQTIMDDESTSKTVFFTDFLGAPSTPNYFVYGPYVTLKKAAYIVRFALKATALCPTDQAFAKIDISCDHGARELVAKEIKGADFTQREKYKVFELNFKTDTILKDVEFRVIYFGKEKLWFDYVEIQQEDIK